MRLDQSCEQVSSPSGSGYIQVELLECVYSYSDYIKRSTPNDPYMVRTAPLTSKRCISYIYLKEI